MKKHVWMTLALAVLLALTTACGATVSSAPAASTPKSSSAEATPPAPANSTAELVLTLEELAKFDGKDGNPAYVAVNGVIYDVTNVPQWAGGEHNGNTAGQDLTDVIANQSPHGLSALDNVPIVGKLAT